MDRSLRFLPALALAAALVLTPAANAAADQKEDALELVALTTRPASLDSSLDVIPFQALVHYTLESVPSGSLMIFVFENSATAASRQSAAPLPVQGSGQAILNMNYVLQPGVHTVTLMIGLFKSEQKMLTWVATNGIDLAPWPGRAAFDKSMTARINADYEGADRYLASAIAASPQSAAYYYWRGDTRIYLRQYEDAIADFNRSIGLLPDDRASYTGRGIARLWNGDPTQAVADLTFAIDHTSNPDRIAAFAHRARGTAYALLSQPTSAIADYRAYLEMLPGAEDRADVEGWIADLT
jgi:tetratricopeptide (TPR) repeat protein